MARDSAGPRMIDIHSHFFPRISQAEAHAVDAQRAPWLTVDEGGKTGQIMLGDKPFRPVHDELWDSDARVRGLDTAGIAMQIICATPVMFGYAWEAPRAADWAARMNEKAAAYCAPHPTRLRWLSQSDCAKATLVEPSSGPRVRRPVLPALASALVLKVTP